MTLCNLIFIIGFFPKSFDDLGVLLKATRIEKKISTRKRNRTFICFWIYVNCFVSSTFLYSQQNPLSIIYQSHKVQNRRCKRIPIEYILITFRQISVNKCLLFTKFQPQNILKLFLKQEFERFCWSFLLLSCYSKPWFCETLAEMDL